MRQDHYLSRFWLAVWTWFIVVLVIMPFLFIVLVSFTSSKFVSLPTQGFSLQWYTAILAHKAFIVATANSLIIAFVAALAAMLLGVLGALAIVRYRFRARGLIRLTTISPLFIPMVMTGLAVLVFFSTMGWRDPTLRLVVAHTTLTLPYVVRTVTASLTGYDINQELAARNLGAHPLLAFFYVTLPQVGPGILAGGVLAFIVSFDNVGLSIFLTTPRMTTLPVELFIYASFNQDPMVASISVVIIVFSFLVVALVERTVGLQRLMR